jgi:SsrA-binding protein
MTTLAQNRRAAHDYHIDEKFEAGIALVGTETKSCRAHEITLTDAYAAIKDGELWLLGAHIAPYSHGNRQNHDPRRPRRLLMHRQEIRRLTKAVEAKGMTLIPLRFYLVNRGKIKVELGLCRGKAEYDKRDTLRRKEHEQEMRKAQRMK